MSEESIISIRDAELIGRIITAVFDGKKVAKILDDGGILEGTLRHFVVSADNYNLASGDTDVRNAYIRITLSSGFEVVDTLTAMAHELGKGLLYIRD